MSSLLRLRTARISFTLPSTVLARAFRALPGSDKGKISPRPTEDQHDFDPTAPLDTSTVEVDRVFVGGWFETSLPISKEELGRLFQENKRWEEAQATESEADIRADKTAAEMSTGEMQKGTVKERTGW